MLIAQSLFAASLVVLGGACAATVTSAIVFFARQSLARLRQGQAPSLSPLREAHATATG